MDEELLQSLWRDSPLPVTIVDAGRPGMPITCANEAWHARYSAAASRQPTLIDHTLDGNEEPLARARAALRETRACKLVVRRRRGDNTIGHDEIDLFPLSLPRRRLFAAIHRDISEHVDVERRLRSTNKTLLRLALHDSLTGIYNRQFFDKMLEREWRLRARAGGMLALLMMDIDDFKRFNDERGHHAGDQCLRIVAAILDTSLRRGGDFVARYGGDEFIALLCGAETGKARQLAALIRERVAATYLGPPTNGCPVTLSIGVALACPGPGREPTALLDSADEALYRAKAGGKNRIAFAGYENARVRERDTGIRLSS